MTSEEAAVFVRQVESHFKREYMPHQRREIVKILTSLGDQALSRVQVKATEGEYLPSVARWREVERAVTGVSGPDRYVPAGEVATDEVVSFYLRCMAVMSALRPQLRRRFFEIYNSFESPHKEPVMQEKLEKAEKIVSS